MADYTPVYAPGTTFSQTASAAITGGQVLMNTGDNTVGPAALNSLKVVGVAAHDAASGARVTVHSVQGVVHESTSSGTVAAGDVLSAGAAGVVVTSATPAVGQPIGVALTGGTGGAKVRWIGK